MLGSLTHLNFYRAALAGFLGLVAACWLAADAQAQSTTLSATRGNTINIAVVGDSVANDLGNGMEDLFEHRPNVRIVKKTRFSTGLVRTDYYDWDATISKFLKRHNPDVVVVVIGGNDHQAMRIKGKRYEPFDKGWVAEYSKRVSRFMNYLKREHTQVYWVSLPPVRSDELTKAYRVLNGIYRREAANHGIHYLSIWDKFLVKGAYSSFGESLEGVRRRLRKEDGMHFTEAGQVVFASYVANALGLH